MNSLWTSLQWWWTDQNSCWICWLTHILARLFLIDFSGRRPIIQNEFWSLGPIHVRCSYIPNNQNWASHSLFWICWFRDRLHLQSIQRLGCQTTILHCVCLNRIKMCFWCTVKLIKISLCQGLSHITVLQYLPAIPKNINVIAARNSKETRTERKKMLCQFHPNLNKYFKNGNGQNFQIVAHKVSDHDVH